jgi:taurine dioxygenase
MRNSTIDIRPVSAKTGAEIHGVDISKPLSDQTVHEIRHALADHSVIFFRNQDLTPAQHVAFARQMGTISTSEFMNPVAGFAEISDVRKEPEQTRNIGGNWHTDHPFDAIPPLGSILVARELPDRGGDTLFASTYAAYDELSDGLKKTLEGMRAIHTKRKAYDPKNLSAERQQFQGEEVARHEAAVARRGEVEASHPVVFRHPVSGRKLLYVNRNYTLRFDGWTVEESEPLLKYLFEHATRPENTYRFRWEKGSIAFWDNFAALHLALNDYHGSLRSMHRITLEGTAPQPLS